jgi:uncharacterized protein (TIGR00251 family)
MAARFIEVKVRPGSPTSSLTEEASGRFTASLRSPPVDGKANAELIGLVARHFGCPRSAVSIRTGAAGRTKLVRIEAR